MQAISLSPLADHKAALPPLLSSGPRGARAGGGRVGGGEGEGERAGGSRKEGGGGVSCKGVVGF